MSDSRDGEEGGDGEDLLAAEYVLGVLDAAERRAVDRRAAGTATLAASIAAWERRLHPLVVLVPPVSPPLDLWPRLQRAIGPAPADRATRLWRNTALAAMAVAAGLALALLRPTPPAPAPAIAVAALSPAGAAGPAFVARVLPDGGLVVAALAAAAVPPGRDLELWALPQGAKTVVSLGVLPAAGGRVRPSRLTAVGGKLLVSLEPKGGSPSGQPTGPVLYAGVIAATL